MLYEKILIIGKTITGERFRPSDWAERLYYTVASYGKNGRVIFNPLVNLKQEDNSISFAPNKETKESLAITGTMRALATNMIQGVETGFEKRLEINGVGYRASLEGNTINLSLGFSHPIKHDLPEGVTADLPSNTEIILKSMDKQLVGQVAAEIRDYRPPEPYKGKGVKYSDEKIIRKESKKA